MSEISFTGSFAAGTLSVPDLYINVQPGQPVIQPATSGLVGVEGVASWGPVNRAMLIGSPTQLVMYGNPVNRQWDLSTALAVVLQAQQAAGIGANLIVNRVTDGTDVAATANVASVAADTETVTVAGTLTIGDLLKVTFTSAGITGSPLTVSYTTKAGDTPTTMATGIAAAINASANLQAANISAKSAAAVATITYPASLSVTFAAQVNTGSGSETLTAAPGAASTIYGMGLTSLYTGTAANGDPYAIAPGSNSTTATPTWRLTLQHPGMPAEIYDNLGAGLTGNALWAALVAAINGGSSIQRGPSQMMVATVGNSTAAMAATSGTLSGGTDGATAPTSAQFVGSNTAGARTGVYTFTNTGCTDLVIADFDDETQEPSLIAFGQGQGIYVYTNGAPGESVTAGQTNKQTQGSFSPWLKRMLGDWVYWNDNFNGVQRLLGPATFAAALISTLQPQMSGTNKQCYGVVATQRSVSGSGPYGVDELAVLESAGIDVICNPIPAGSMFGLRNGLNASANGATLNDAWPRLTSWLARSIAGPNALGTLIGQLITPSYYQEGYDILDAFLAPLKTGINGGSPMINAYQITFDAAHNPQAQQTGVTVAQVLVQFLQEARVFLINMQTGATVVIPANSNVSAAVQAVAQAA